MIIGSPATFSIESGITCAFAEPGARALGYFVLHIGGERYGVHAPDASLLACSLDKVVNRIAHRGSHVASFADGVDGGKIADAFREAVYAPHQEGKLFFGLSHLEFSDLLQARQIVWAPDGDEAFDDGSFVLHFDAGDRVRLIGFRCGDGYHHDPATLRDISLSAADFYGRLEAWSAAFLAEWKSAPKNHEGDLNVPDRGC